MEESECTEDSEGPQQAQAAQELGTFLGPGGTDETMRKDIGDHWHDRDGVDEGGHGHDVAELVAG